MNRFVAENTYLFFMHQGEIIRNIIKRKGFKVATVASKLHVSRMTMYKKFKKKQLPLSFLFLISKAIGYDFSSIFPSLVDYEKIYNKCRGRMERNYIDILEKYVDLFLLMTKVMQTVKCPEVRKQIVDFLTKRENLPWQNEKK